MLWAPSNNYQKHITENEKLNIVRMLHTGKLISGIYHYSKLSKKYRWKIKHLLACEDCAKQVVSFYKKINSEHNHEINWSKTLKHHVYHDDAFYELCEIILYGNTRKNENFFAQFKQFKLSKDQIRALLHILMCEECNDQFLVSIMLKERRKEIFNAT
jgi:hypothetical protein